VIEEVSEDITKAQEVFFEENTYQEEEIVESFQ
jgi:hypothetical protein